MNDELTPLGNLIDSRQSDKGWSLNYLGIRAQELGLSGLAKSNIAKLKSEPPKHISTVTIKNLAVLLQLPERVVVEAAIRSTNLAYPELNTASAAEAIQNDIHIAPRDKRILLAMLTAMKEDENDGQGEAPEYRKEAAAGGVSFAVLHNKDREPVWVGTNSGPATLNKEQFEEFLEGMAAKKGRNFGKEQREHANTIGEENQDD